MTIDLCKYRNLFGEVGTGPHSYRIFNIAIFDVVTTVLAAWISYLVLRYLGFTISFWWVLLVWFLMGILAHRLFCVRTTIDKFLFG